MILTGIASVSFRGNTAEEIICAAKEAGLQGIEWGGDVHVPAGDVARAREVRRLTEEAGLRVTSYGTYYCIGGSDDPARDFSAVLQSAEALGVKIVRIWGGEKGSAKLTDDEFVALAKEAQLLCDLAAEKGMLVSLECHNDSVTDDYRAELRFFEAVNRPNLTTYWQPNQDRSEAYNFESIRALAKYITNVHVFHIRREDDGSITSFPLEEGSAIWHEYLALLGQEAAPESALIEFVYDNRIETLAPTAKTLTDWVRSM